MSPCITQSVKGAEKFDVPRDYALFSSQLRCTCSKQVRRASTLQHAYSQTIDKVVKVYIYVLLGIVTAGSEFLIPALVNTPSVPGASVVCGFRTASFTFGERGESAE